jgi:membrane associated rhomboid family serine protease
MPRPQRVYRVRPEPATSRALLGLIAANVAVFALWVLGGRHNAFLSANFLVSDDRVLTGRVWTLLTSEFSHTDPMHLLFNMLALWVFGRDVEQVIGSARFIGLYLAGAVAASVAHVVWNLIGAHGVPALGASGAVMAIAVVFGGLFPTRTLMVNFFVPVPAAIAVGIYVLLDVAGVIGGGGATAHAAHLGGAAVGLAYWLSIRPRIRRG